MRKGFGRTAIVMGMFLVPYVMLGWCHMSVEQMHHGVSDVSLIDTLWPVRTWSISYVDGAFPYAEYPEAPEGPGCEIKGFTVDERERFYVLGGNPKVSLVCYEGSRQVWRREMDVSLDNSIFALMKVMGDSVYFFDEQRFRLWRIHRDGHGKPAVLGLVVSPDDSLAWGSVCRDRFRIQTGKKRDMKHGYDDYNSRMRMDDVFFSGLVKNVDDWNLLFFDMDKRYRMFVGTRGGDVVGENSYDYAPLYVRTASRDTIREIRFYGPARLSAMTSISKGVWGVVEPTTIWACVGDWLYMPGYMELTKEFIIRKYDARPLWRWMKEAGIE